jgi:hypothetical protein
MLLIIQEWVVRFGAGGTATKVLRNIHLGVPPRWMDGYLQPRKLYHHNRYEGAETSSGLRARGLLFLRSRSSYRRHRDGRTVHEFLLGFLPLWRIPIGRALPKRGGGSGRNSVSWIGPPVTNCR